MKIILMAVALTVGLWGADTAWAADDWLPTIPQGSVEVRLDLHASGFTGSVRGVDQGLPTKVVPIPDGSGRMVVTTLGGIARVMDAQGNVPVPFGGVYLNTNTAESRAGGQVGLSSLAFHPGFADAGSPGFGKLYALVAEDPKPNPADYDFRPAVGNLNNHAALLVEYTVDPGSIGSDFLLTSGTSQNVTRRELMVIQEPDDEHNANDLAFDNQGRLYVSLGDGLFEFNGGVNNEAQNAADLGTVLGKVLRIDPLGSNSANGRYGIVADNVFAADGDPDTLGEVFSYGHRNPWRLSVDRETQQVLVGEVGHFNIEEINLAVNGGNFGWPTMEGSFQVNPANGFDLTPDTDGNGDGVGDFAAANGFIEPVFEYDHEDGVSVTGGFVYRGGAIPSLYGKYIFGDFSGGDLVSGARLFAGDLETGAIEALRLDPGGVGFDSVLVSFGEDASGELYAVLANGKILSIGPSLRADLNGDGFIGAGDLDLLLGLWNQSVAPGALGDLTGDGFVGAGDLDVLLGAWNSGAAPAASAVPEPAGAAMLLPGLAVVLRRRRGA